MRLLEYLDRRDARKLERWHIQPPRPRDSRMIVGTLFFAGYYTLVFVLIKTVVPEVNAPLIRDSMLVLGPVVGAIGSALFRTDVKDEIAASNTGTAFRALGKSADATIAAAATMPADNVTASETADRMVDAAQEERANIQKEVAE